ncbi:MAG: gliding motility-associated C-terminal domain-containing protein [Flavobacteriales bacterium]|jgi:gliding motility-associated-like protein|nr:gliding motility-associated C-terminal domain-containing protein [Flavobacteriales bacterium]
MPIKPITLALLFSITAPIARAQCTGSIDLGPDTTLCAGDSLVLDAGEGFLTYNWNNGAGSEQLFTATATGLYTCVAGLVDTTINLVVNGDFSAGATGFSSGYVPGTGGEWGLLTNEGEYAVVANGADAHNNFAPCADHTGGGSNMLVVNGAGQANVPIWCQTINVVPGTDYAFSAWLVTMISENPAVLQFTINGNPIGQPLEAPFATCEWNQFHAVWNAGASTSAQICITNQNTILSGNDFALDDITFHPFCTFTDTVEVVFTPAPAPDLGPDQTLCSTDPFTLDPGVPGADSYLWNDGLATTPELVITAQGWYWVEVTTAGCTGTDSVWIGMIDLPGVDLGPDLDLCEGDTVTLAPGVLATHLWHDGSNGPTWTGWATAEVWAQVSSGPCTASDTVMVVFHPVPAPDLGTDQNVCGDGPVPLDPGVAGDSYDWNNGQAHDAQWEATATGWYHVSVTAHGCTGTDSVHIELVPVPVVDIGGDRTLCVGDSVVLVAGPAGGDYLWHDGSTGATWTGWASAETWVVVTEGFCSAEDQAMVTFEECVPVVDMPNVFTPNGDGDNPLFTPVHIAGIGSLSIEVFNRWGQLVFSSTSPNFGWNGRTVGGSAAPEGTYFWVLRYEGIKGDAGAQQGVVTLLR